HRDARRPAGAIVRAAGPERGRRGHRDARGPRHTRRAASAPAGVHRRGRVAVRVLPERRDPDREGRARRPARRERRRDPGRARRRAVPLLHPHPDAARAPALRRWPQEGAVTTSRRDFLKTGGALVVGFGAAALLPRSLAAAPETAFSTRASHIDPGALDAWLAVGADGRVT